MTVQLTGVLAINLASRLASDFTGQSLANRLTARLARRLARQLTADLALSLTGQLDLLDVNRVRRWTEEVLSQATDHVTQLT